MHPHPHPAVYRVSNWVIVQAKDGKWLALPILETMSMAAVTGTTKRSHGTKIQYVDGRTFEVRATLTQILKAITPSEAVSLVLTADDPTEQKDFQC